MCKKKCIFASKFSILERMKRVFSLCTMLFALCTLLFAEHIPADTISFTATKVVSEPDPNNQNYCFTFVGPVDGFDWKMQLDYYADSMYGTIGDEECRLPKGGGANMNWVRKEDGKYNIFYGYHVEATVATDGLNTIIDVEGLYRENKWGSTDTTWHYVKVHAVEKAVEPKRTVDITMGWVAVIPNAFLEYIILNSQNEDYSLAFGVSRISELKAGTYYSADLIRPDFVELATGDTIRPLTAQLEVTDAETPGQFDLMLSLLSTDSVMYHLAMYTDMPEPTDTVRVTCRNSKIMDYTMEYGFLYVTGQSADYQMGLALNPEAFSQDRFEASDVNLSFTQIVYHNEQVIRVHSAWGTIGEDEKGLPLINASLFGVDGVLYEAAFVCGGLPFATDTTVITCGDKGVVRVDYTQGEGRMGLVLMGKTDTQNEAQVYLFFRNDYEMNTFLTKDAFDYERSYITTVEGTSIVFHDLAAAEMALQKDAEGVLSIQVEAVGINSVLYQVSASMAPKYFLTGNGMDVVEYTIDSEDEGSLMAAVRDGYTYQLQFQRADEWDEGVPVGSFEAWSFVFTQDTIDGITGKYAYSDGTLDLNERHTLQEDETEILIAPIDGSLSLQATGQVIVPGEVIGRTTDYKTHMYQIEALFMGENNMVYHLLGSNYLLCLDDATGDFVELTEDRITALDEALAPQGLRVRKVLREGMLLLESTEGTYHISGSTLTPQPSTLNNM